MVSKEKINGYWKGFKSWIVSSNKSVQVLLVFIGVLVISLGLGLSLASIKTKKEVEVNGKSSFTLAIPSPRNSNFIRYVASQQIASTFTTGLFVPPPPDKIYETMQLPKIRIDLIENIHDITQDGSIVDAFYKKNQAGFKRAGYSVSGFWKFAYPGMASFSKPLGDGRKTISGIVAPEDFSSMTILLDKKRKWFDWERKTNGKTEIVSDFVLASDFVQTWRYILNLSVASEHLRHALIIGLNNTDICNTEQEEYIKKGNGEPLSQPFGYFWSEEQELLKEARKKGPEEVTRVQIMINNVNNKAQKYTPSCKSLFLDLPPERIKQFDLTKKADVEKLQKMVDDAAIIFSNKYNYIHYKFAIPKENFVNLLTSVSLVDGVYFLPSNKKFIDYIGGINKFGLDINSIIGNGSHKVKEITFGNLGYAYLAPNKDFWDYKNMLTGNVKLIFNQEPYALDALFKDGKIATTRLTKDTLQVLYNTKKYRQYLKKQIGYGTFALVLNIESNKHKPLNDPDLRRALYYIMNREDALKIANWDSSFPVTTFTAFKQTSGLTSYKAAIEIYEDSEVVNTEAPQEAGGKNIPLRVVSYTQQSAKRNELEALKKTDKSFLPKVAKFYLDRYKAKHPNQSSVELVFLYDTSAKESERMYILLDSLIRKYLGGYIKLIGKGVPSNFFESLRTIGKFDLTTRIVNPSGSGHLNYFRFFFWKDELSNEKGNIKTRGYSKNISGGFTFEDWFKSLGNKENEVRKRLGISVDIWEYMKFLTKPYDSTNPNYKEGYQGRGLVNWERRVNEIEALALNKEKLNTYIGISDVIKNFTTNYESIKIQLSIGFEKILREAVPVIPLMEVDTFWTATKLYAEQAYNQALVLMFPYLCDHKPLTILPGCSAIGS